MGKDFVDLIMKILGSIGITFILGSYFNIHTITEKGFDLGNFLIFLVCYLVFAAVYDRMALKDEVDKNP